MDAPLVAPSRERWSAIEPVFDRALDLAPECRATYLAEACTGDPALRSEVERLLQASEAGDWVLDEPASGYAWPLVVWVAERRALVAGQWLGPYLIERELGRGGMATVYQAHDPRHGRRVALKVLRPEISGMLGGERFAREIAIAARLSHPHILPLYDSGVLEQLDASPVLYYTMPYVAGRSLRDRLREQPQLPVAEALGIAGQVASALDYAHRQGVIHRDIKPENILLAEGGAQVADFGIARALDSAGGERLTATGLALGTPAYMSPEQAALSGKVDGRADLYALGCVLYEMLAGEPPFTGPTAQAILARHAMDPAPSLHTVRPEVSPRLARVVLRALAKVPSDRFPTAGAFATALAAPEVARQQAAGLGRFEPTRRWRPMRVSIALAGIAALAIALGRTGVARRTSSVTVDPAVVAIAPFQVGGGNASLGYLREGMVDLLATRLGGTPILRPIDSRSLLNAWHKTGVGDDLAPARIITAASQLGAGALIQGDVSGSGSRMTISASVIRVPRGGARGRVSVEGPADSLSSLVDRLAAGLLVRAAGEPAERFFDLDRRPLPIIREYLHAWLLVRQGRDIPQAIQKFNTLLAADSSFALAALGRARADYQNGESESRNGVLAAWPRRKQLGPRDRAYLDALAGSSDPEHTRPREQRAAITRYTRVAPDDADAWIIEAESRGGGPLFVFPDDAERSNVAATRAVALDSTRWRVLGLVVENAAEIGDTAGMRRALRAVLARDSTSPGSLLVQWEAAITLGDTALSRRIASSDSMVSVRPDAPLAGPAWDMVRFYLREGLGLRDLDQMLRRTITVSPTGDQRRVLQHHQYILAMIRGRADGVPVPDWWDREYAEFWYLLGALFMDGDPALADSTAPALARRIGTRPTEAWCCVNRFAAAEYALAHDDLAIARSAWRDLDRGGDLYRYRGKGSDSVMTAGMYRGLAAIVAAQLAAHAGEPVATDRLRELDSMLADPPAGGWEDVHNYGGLISARLHEQRGEFREALARLRNRPWESDSPVLVTWHREEGRIAAEAGDTAGAVRAYRRFLGIRADAEPRLQPQVRQARAELAALLHAR